MITSLPRSTPESQDVSSQRILNFLRTIEQPGLEFHSFMLVRQGQVVAEGGGERYAPELPHVLYSYSKSFCPTAAGFAVDENLFSLDDRVVSFFPQDRPADLSPNLALMRVRDLLAMA